MSPPVYESLDGSDILMKYFVTAFRTGYLKCQNVVLPEYFRKFGERIQNMGVRDDDIWVITFPKAGTTWTQEMVWCLAKDLDYGGAEQFLPERFPFLEHSPMFDYERLIAANPNMTFPHYVLDSVDYIEKMPSPRFIKAHLPLHLLPDKLTNNSTKAKIIYTARNPRDTCISYYHHSKLLEGYKGNFEQFCQLFLDDMLCFTPFWDHIRSAWNKKESPNLLVLKYEDMKKDLDSVILKTAKFLGKSFSQDQIEGLKHHLSFESMKGNRAVNYEPVVEINKKYNLIEAEGSFMRKGAVGEWKDAMTENMTRKFQVWEDENLKKLPGFTF